MNVEEEFQRYLRAVRRAKNEAMKADLFRDFVRKIFPSIEFGFIGGFYPELEKHLKISAGGRIISGRADSLFGNLIIEFEFELDERHLQEAENQLKKYSAGIWLLQDERKQKRSKLTCIATDGIEFKVYRPRAIRVGKPISLEQICLDEIDQANFEELTWKEAYEWLRRYIVVAASELVPIDPDKFAKEFGVGSEVFNKCMKLLKEGWKKARSKAITLYEQWDSHLRIVYGNEVASEELYLKHTYLATLAKLVVYASYSRGALPLSRKELIDILSGIVFKKWRITNFIEEDFFSWVHSVEEGIETAKILVSKLAHYDLSSVSIDVFKELYQSLVDPEARHDLGEYYTPDWLAEMIVRDVLSDDPEKSVLDPTCGSGTFLAMAIMYKKRELRDKSPKELLEHILKNVAGIDVHPLAVIIARATYLTALGSELLEARERDLVIPVYLADSIRLPKEKIVIHGGVSAYSIEAEAGKELVIPSSVALNPLIADLVIDAVKEYAASIAEGAPDSLELFSLHLDSYGLKRHLSDGDVQALYYTAQNMTDLIKMERDAIWGFILKNYYKPVFFSRRKFDVIVGNPPWLSYRYVRNTRYQEFLKNLMIDGYGLLDSDKRELITQMELATLFFVRSAELYLEDDGIIGFVMPRGIFVADQHNNLRSGKIKKPKLKLIRIIDLEGVKPLFNVPSCVLFAQKREEMEYPVNGTVIEGKLSRKNEDLGSALRKLNIRHTKFELRKIGERSFLVEADRRIKEVSIGWKSEYYNEFRNGATIYPKQFWCVEIVKHPKLGFDPNYPYVKTSERAIKRAKAGYKGVVLGGNVESRFLHACVSGSELVPFGLTGVYLAVLPVESTKGELRIIEQGEAIRRGFKGLADWLQKAERIWNSARGKKVERMNVYQRLDYQKNLTLQNLRKRFKVLYNTSGTYLVSCVVENKPITMKINSVKVKVNGVIADWKTYWMETNNEDEAYYLSAIMNSPIIDELIKPMQSKGAFGQRDIVKKPLELPIPKFDPSNPIHKRLAQIGKECHQKVQKILPALTTKYESIGKIRSEIRRHLERELEEIDELVRKILE